MQKNKSIDKLRKEIDVIDGKIVGLIEKRLMKIKKIGKIKKLNNQKINDKKREDEILKNVFKDSKLSLIFIKKLYKVIFEESRRNQK